MTVCHILVLVEKENFFCYQHLENRWICSHIGYIIISKEKKIIDMLLKNINFTSNPY